MRIDSRFEKKNLLFVNRPSKKCDSGKDWTRITRISMRIGEKTRFARIWPSASKIGIFLRIDSRESAKVQRWCANRLPTKSLPIDDTDPIWKFSIDAGSPTDLQNAAELSPEGKPIWNFSIDPAALMRTRLRMPFLRMPFEFRDFYSQKLLQKSRLRCVRLLFGLFSESGGTKRDKRSQIHSFSLIFADFRLFLQIFAFPGNSRFSQKTADVRRKPQIFAETGLSHLVCPF